MPTILVCDDEKDIVSALEIYLHAEGYDTVAAYTGHEAVERLREKEIQLVLLDIMMPEMDGISALSRIRQESNVPVILLTAKSEDTDKVLGEVVRISQNGGNGKSTISLSERAGVSGDLDPVRRTLGTRSVADGAMVFTEDKLTTLAALDKTVVPQGRIGYARTNDAGEVDLIVIKNSSNALYGRAIVTTEPRYDSFSGRDYRVRFLSIKTYNNQESQPIETALAVEDGAYVEARLNGKGDGYASVTALKKLTDVPASAWVSENVVNYGDQTYVISDKVICCNRDSGGWFEDLDAAKAYGGTMDLYVKDGTVHVVEVRT